MSSNQPPPLVGYNVFESDPALREALEREGASWAQELVHDLGRLAGTGPVRALIASGGTVSPAGNGAVGKLIKDPAFAQKVDDTVTNLDNMLKSINSGKGSAGQFLQNRALYDHLDQTADQAQQLIKGMRENPKKYLVIQLKLF